MLDQTKILGGNQSFQMHDGGGLAEDAKKLEGTTVPRPWRRIGRSPS
jgi:hypothetical protein